MNRLLPEYLLTHSLQYFYTGVTGFNFPEFTAVGQMDGEPFVYYDSNIRKMIPKTEWIQKVVGDDPDYWDRNIQKLQVCMCARVRACMHVCAGLHTVQMMYGCELDDDQTERGYRQYGYDGEDFISLDLKAGTYDGSFQKRSILTLSPEELKNGDEYTCVVHHSSLKNGLVLLVSDRRILHGRIYSM
uniref:MHC class I-like antigen recognition-like domain-containing protein n=1 Tax=Astyanax mexicanus TaxID=7994 RepID=A0A8B9H3N0_ASTMX